jgi:hypothetical protein
LGVSFPGGANRRHFRGLAWRAPVSVAIFQFPFRHGGDWFNFSRRDRFSRCPSGCRARLWNRIRVSVALDCAALRSPVVIIELARLIWADRIDEPSHGTHALLWRQRRLWAAHIGRKSACRGHLPIDLCRISARSHPSPICRWPSRSAQGHKWRRPSVPRYVPLLGLYDRKRCMQ